jgi:acyl carrier protein phosphodiesterase
MNILAHALLAGPDDGLRLGSTMGDFVRGTPDQALPPAVRDGIVLHRAIDVFTDAHPQVVAARRLFEPPYRRYAGILLDMWFDLCLARDFGRWSDEPLVPYSDALRALLHANAAILPERLPRFLAYMDRADLPAAYADPVVLGHALEGISQRLSRSNPVGEGLPVLLALEVPLQRHFVAFFAELAVFARGWRGAHGYL